MKTATVTVTFQDLREGVLRNPGDVFQADDERMAYLEKLGFVQISPDDPPKTTRKRKPATK